MKNKTMIILLILASYSSVARAGCNQDPNTLTPELRKAYNQSVQMCKEIGCTVSVRCFPTK